MKLHGWLFLCFIAIPGVALGTPPEHDRVLAGGMLVEALARLDRDRITTGILYDRVVPLSRIERYNGAEGAGPLTLGAWRQIYYELYRASLDEPSWPDLKSVIAYGDELVASGVVPIAVLNFSYNRIWQGALEEGSIGIEEGRLVDRGGEAYATCRAFAGCALRPSTHRGSEVLFELPEGLYYSNDERRIGRIEVDFDDDAGYRVVRFGERHTAHYSRAGEKLIRVRVYYDDGAVLHTVLSFAVEHLQTPVPHDTLSILATIPFGGEYGTGEGYVYLSDIHSTITNPVVVIEGFDIDNTMNWDELYHLLNQESLIETLRAEGFDAVVLNFTDATDYIQKNAYVVVELVQQVIASMVPGDDIAVIGASMGGLAGRYALAYMEHEGIDHRTRAFISFDVPHRGANIPLGVQYWMEFFSGESADAEFLRDRLNSPAARQMLVYHFTVPPGATGECDPLMTAFFADIEGVGGYPAALRKTAIANGSGYGEGQGFGGGDQIILYEYTSFLVDITGNVWAVPDGGPQIVFDGLMDLIWPLPDTEMQVTVSGTEPYDSAPGGSRASMTQMDTTEAPYGDIVALHGSHCFIPTISALDLETEELFYDIAGDPGIMDITPFDAIYYPVTNEEHVTITSANAEWFIMEIERGITDAGEEAAGIASGPHLDQNFPNPFNPRTVVRFIMPHSGAVSLRVFDVRGGRIATLIDGNVQAGPHVLSWDGRDDAGRPVASGVYFCRLEACGEVMTRTMVLVR